MRIQSLGTWNVRISRKITWSRLAKLGTTSVMRLTTLVPLIGLFLLFNEQTELFFKFPEFFKNDIGVASGSDISRSNLYFLYFGLCALGVASILFSLLCPREIQDQPNQKIFVAQTTSAETPVLAKANFREVLNLHHAYERNEQSWNNPNYPGELESDFHSLMEEFYTKVEHPAEEDSPFPEVMTGTGYLDFTEFARILWSNPRIAWNITIPVFELAPQLAKDVAFVKFNALDYTLYSARLLITATYGLGFLLLIYPTLRVFFLLTYGLVFGWSSS